MRKKKTKPVMEVKCDHCHTYTSSFVVTAEYKKFCRLQTPGFPPDIDCMSDYLNNLKPLHSKSESKLNLLNL